MHVDVLPQVGDMLVVEGLITAEDLQRAVRTQAEKGGLLGRTLILQGAVKRRPLYETLAKQWGVPFVDLIADPPDRNLVNMLHPELLVGQGWIPLSRKGDKVTIATSIRPTDELLDEASALLGTRKIKFVATTDWDVDQAVAEACREVLLYESAELHANEHPSESAKLGLVSWQKYVPVTAFVLVVIAMFASPVWALSLLLGLANAVFLMNIGFKVLAGLRAGVVRGQKQQWEYEKVLERRARGISVQDPALEDTDLPTYTILLPVYKEANIVQKLLRNLGNLDYPAAKIEILLLLEEDDVETLEAAKAVSPPETVRIVVVPSGDPQTKPRACNYGLTFARGEFLVIYDAEDHPEPGQLRDSVEAFRRDAFEREFVDPTQKRLVCVQSALNYENADYNILTRMFAIEYSYWFDSMLPGLDQSNLPIPLGGTSNHFDTEVLRQLGAWDPYNVTEDADLGLRVAAHGYRVGVISETTTWEEAASQVRPWIRQRTRWIKGYIMTSGVNTRHPIQTVKNNGFYGSLSIVALIMGTPLAFLLYPLVLGFTVITYVGVQVIGLHLPSWLLVIGTFNMVISNTLMIGASMYVSRKRYGMRVAIFSLLLPAYWVLHSIAAYRAVFQIIFQPHKWEKTPHGLSEGYISAGMGVPD